MIGYLEKMDHKFSLFDPVLLSNFSQISTQENADLRKVFDNTLVQHKPVNAVTIVQNHDTQAGQTMATEIAPFFMPLAHALILLRNAGYPCVFYGDVYGIQKSDDTDAKDISCGGKIPDLVLARKLYAYGEQNDYFDEPNCIGWVRRGTWDRPSGMAVVMSNAGPGQRRMFVGEMHAGQKWTDILGWQPEEVVIGDDGFGVFPSPGVSMAVFVNSEAEGRDRFGKL